MGFRFPLFFFLTAAGPFLLLGLQATTKAASFPTASSPRQMILAIAPDNHSFHGSLRLYHRLETGLWVADDAPWPVLFGKNGLAWGRGLNLEQPGLQKKERDGRSPAGRFRVGLALGNEPELPVGANAWPYHQKTVDDAWIDDPALPHYNHLIQVPAANRPAWFEKQRLRLDDAAYHWLLVIEHNYPDSVPGAGSAIFFHIRRGENVPTAGCTTMPQERLEQVLRWLDPAAQPQFVLLSRADYNRLWKEWDLPAPAQAP